MFRRVITLAPACAFLCATTLSGPLFGQSDPGPQPGPANAGRPLQGLTPQENGTFQEGQRRFRDLVSVRGSQPGTQQERPRTAFQSQQLRGLSCPACCRRQQSLRDLAAGSAIQSADRYGNGVRSRQRNSSLHSRRRSRARGSICPRGRRFSRWRRATPLCHLRTHRFRQLQYHSTGLHRRHGEE